MSIRFILLATILLHVSFAGCRVNLSLFAIHLQATPLTVGLIMSLLAAFPMLFSVQAGRAIDRIGVRRPMLAGSGAVAAATLLAFAAPRLETLFAVSVLGGTGFVLFHIAVNHAAGVVGRADERARNFSLLALGFSTSGFLGPMIAGFAIDAIGHRMTFLLLAAGSVATLALVAIRRVPPPAPDHARHHGEQRRLADLLRVPELRRVFVVSGTLSMAWDLFSFVMPIYGSGIGLSASAIGLILGAFGGAVFLVRLVLPLVVHRIPEWKLLVGAMFTTGLTLAAIPFVNAMGLLLALACLLGIGLGAAQPMIMALLYEKAPPGRGGEAVGVRTLLLNFSQTTIPLLFGALGTALGLAPVFWAMSLALLAGGAYASRR